MKLSDYIVTFLQKKGIRHFFGYQGTMIAHLVDSIERNPETENHSSYNEQGAAFAACGYAQAKEECACAYATSGPGAINLLSGVADAYYDSLPVIFLTGQLNTYEYSGIKGLRQQGFQETDIVAMAKPITKYAVQIRNPEDIVEELNKAYHIATTGRRGPVLIDLPMNIQRSEVENPVYDMTFEDKHTDVVAAQQAADTILEALEQAKEPTIPELLSRYLDKRSEERTGWTSKGKLKGTVGDFNKVMEALDFLRQKEISTVESLDAYLDEASAQAVSIREEIRPMEKRVKEIDRLLFHIGNFEANKPVHAKYAAIRWKKPKEKFAADHKEELDAYNAALRYFKVHLDGAKYSTKKLAGEQAQLSENIASKTEALTAVQEDVKILRDVRHWLNQVLPSEQYRQTAEPGKKPSIQQAVKGREQRIREEQAEKHQQPRRQQKQDMEL